MRSIDRDVNQGLDEMPHCVIYNDLDNDLNRINGEVLVA